MNTVHLVVIEKHDGSDATIKACLTLAKAHEVAGNVIATDLQHLVLDQAEKQAILDLLEAGDYAGAIDAHANHRNISIREVEVDVEDESFKPIAFDPNNSLIEYATMSIGLLSRIAKSLKQRRSDARRSFTSWEQAIEIARVKNRLQEIVEKLGG